jgi:hypothetical protein
MNERPTYVELAAYLYLTLPLVVFQLSFFNRWLGIPGALLIAANFGLLCRHPRRDALTPPWWAIGFSMALVILWMTLGGYGLFFPANSDWIKHYAVVNTLAHHAWPVENGYGVMRYALGWYIVPALAMKWFGGKPNLYLSVWTLIGMVIFMHLSLSLFRSRAYLILLPIVFIAFSGADYFGTWLTGLHMGPLDHYEWWSGWAEYPSDSTSLFWTPQHALPAWIGVALIMRQRNFPTMLESLGIIFFAIVFWSPFAAIGLAPLSLILLTRHGLIPLLSGRTLAALLLIGFPILDYLTAGSDGMPHSLAMNAACGFANPDLCFSMANYLRFVLIEFGIIAALLFAARSEQRGILIAATLSLLVFPLIHFGITNDLTMRASIAPLAVLAILCANVLASRTNAIVIPLTIVLTIGAFTPLGEAYRAVVSPVWFSENSTFEDVAKADARVMQQYFTEGNIFLRSR